MPYSKNNLQSGDVITKSALDNFDNGIAVADATATTANVAAGQANERLDNLTPGTIGAQPAGSYATAADITAAKDRANHTGTQSADTIVDGSTNKAYTSTEKTKLAGIATGATANATNAQLRDRSTHTGTQSADTIVDGTTNKAFLATERTKLAGIATGATANTPDSGLMLVVNAGSVASTARPSTAGAVYWIMDATTQPTNAATGDLIFNAGA